MVSPHREDVAKSGWNFVLEAMAPISVAGRAGSAGRLLLRVCVGEIANR
jgi:hypothetical protein